MLYAFFYEPDREHTIIQALIISKMLCGKCANITFGRLDGDLSSFADFEINQSLVYYVHSENRAALEESQRLCHFCRKIWTGLLRQTTHEYHPKPFDHDRPILLSMLLRDDWIADKSVEDKMRSEVLIASCNHLQITTEFDEQMFDFKDDYQVELDKNDTHTLSGPNMALATLWFKTCSEEHAPCQEILADSPDLPYRIIDLLDPKAPFLTYGLGRGLPYVTLSYKWGSHATRFTLTNDNEAQLSTRIPLDKLPKTFLEAISVCHLFGFRYLWIDALCIKQDDKKEVRSQIQAMGEIYSGSALTIYAVGANSVEVGLGFMRDVFAKKPSQIEMAFEVGAWKYKSSFNIREFQHWESQKGPAPLWDRGWVLQEEVLSTRGLEFHKGEIVWRCSSADASESKPGMVSKLGTAWTPAATGRRDPFQKLRLCLRDKHAMDNESRYPDDNNRNYMFDEWYKTVSHYSRCEFSHFDDVVDALTGISSLLTATHGFMFVAGLWVEDLRLGLLWKKKDTLGISDEDDTEEEDAATAPKTSLKSLLTSIVTLDLFVTKEAPAKAPVKPPRRRINVPCYGGHPHPIGDQPEIWTVKIVPPSWSWLASFGFKEGVEFEHRRRYVFDPDDSMRVADLRFIPLPTDDEEDEEDSVKVTISLTVEAYTRLARISDGELSLLGYTELVDVDDVSDAGEVDDATSEAGSGETRTKSVAFLYPDHNSAVTAGTTVHVVTCVAAYQQYDDLYKESTMFTGIAVVPVPDWMGVFKRVGLVVALDNEWFRKTIDSGQKTDLEII